MITAGSSPAGGFGHEKAHQPNMNDNHSEYSYEMAEWIQTAAKQLQYYDDNDLCTIQDRGDVMFLAYEFGDDELAKAAESPNYFDFVLHKVEFGHV